MIIIGVDSAVNKTGVAIYASRLKKVVWTKQICPPKKFAFPEKLLWIKKEFENILSYCKNASFIVAPNEEVYVVLEDQFLMSNRLVLKQLSIVRGVIQCWALELWGPEHVLIYPVTEWRKLLGIKANRSIKDKKKRVQNLKDQARVFALKNLVKTIKKEDITEDECEASCIALAFLKTLEEKNGKR